METNELLARTALKLLDEVKDEEFFMALYSKTLFDSEHNICGTACCVMGHAAIITGCDASDRKSIDRKANDICGDYPPFIWDGAWKTNKEQAAVRCLMWLDGNAFENYNRTDVYHVPDDLRERLQSYIP